MRTPEMQPHLVAYPLNIYTNIICDQLKSTKYHLRNRIMEEFLLQHADRHQQLIRQFKPKPRPIEGGPVTSPNITVATRIRPLLNEETASGQVPAVFARFGESGVVDLHELRRVVRGPPPLNVSHGPFSSSMHIFVQ